MATAEPYGCTCRCGACEAGKCCNGQSKHWPYDDQQRRYDDASPTDTIDMDAIARKVCEAGHAAYVEMTGGGVATIFASREWEPRAVLFNGQVRQVRLPKARQGTEGHCDIAAGPGWFDPHWQSPGARALGSPDDFSIGPDDVGIEDEQYPDRISIESVNCDGMSEVQIADHIIAMLRDIP